jgi:hypothetical protein
VIFCGRKGTTKQHAILSKNQWPLLKSTLSTEVLSGKRIILKNLNPLLQQFQLQSSDEEDDKDKKAFMKSYMASWKSFQGDKKAQKNKRKLSDNDTS